MTQLCVQCIVVIQSNKYKHAKPNIRLNRNISSMIMHLKNVFSVNNKFLCSLCMVQLQVIHFNASWKTEVRLPLAYWWSKMWTADLGIPVLMNEIVKGTWQQVPDQCREDWKLKGPVFIMAAFHDITPLQSLGAQISRSRYNPPQKKGLSITTAEAD